MTGDPHEGVSFHPNGHVRRRRIDLLLTPHCRRTAWQPDSGEAWVVATLRKVGRPAAAGSALAEVSKRADGGLLEWAHSPRRKRDPSAGLLRPRTARDEQSLVSIIAHELRAPVASLAMSTELLAEDFDGLEAHQIRKMVSGIHRRSIWLQGLVENLMCAATIREGRLRIFSEPIDLVDVALRTRAVVEPLLTQKGQRLRVVANHRLRPVMADDRRIGQVLVNLITNASKFSEPGTRIDVTFAARANRVRVAVADQGSGLPHGGAGRLFAPFTRATELASTGQEGLGLGLAIVKSIVEAHGGRVGAMNQRRGGARFWFELWASPDDARVP